MFLVAVWCVLALFSAPGAPRAKEVFTMVGLGGGGGMYWPSFSPYDPGLILLSCDMGGVYRSTDRGDSWELIHFRLTPAFSYTRPGPIFTPDRMYWISGSDGLCFSDDKGLTWHPMPKGPWTKTPRNPIRYFALLPGKKTEFLVSTDHGVWIGYGRIWKELSPKAGGPVFVLENNEVFASIQPGEMLHRAAPGGEWRNLAVLPGAVKALTGARNEQGSLLLASVEGLGLVRSTDSGNSWQPCKTPYENENHLVMPPGQSRVAYAQQQDSAKTQQLLKSTDGGASWRPIFRMSKNGKPQPGCNVELSWLQTGLRWDYFFTKGGFAVDPFDPDFSLVTTQGELYASRDGGESWQQRIMRPLSPPQPGADRQQSIGLEVSASWGYYFDPADPAREYIAYTDVGFARSLDHGRSWSLSVQGSPWKNTYYDLAFDPDQPGRLYAAASRFHGIPHYRYVSRTFPGHVQYKGGVLISDDWGATWKVPYARTDKNALPEHICTSVAVDPDSPADKRRLFAAVFGETDQAGVYVSENGGKTWKQTPAQPGKLPNRHAYKLRVHPETGDLYCLVTGFRSPAENFFNPEGGGIWMSSDKGASWRHLSRGSKLNRWATAFAFDPGNAKGLYVTAATPQGGKGVGGVYATRDLGETWSQILNDDTVRRLAGGHTYDHHMAVAAHPDDPQLLFAGTTLHGLFYSRDKGKTWHWCRDFPFANAQSINFDPADKDRMTVTTFGAGTWTASLKDILK